MISIRAQTLLLKSSHSAIQRRSKSPTVATTPVNFIFFVLWLPPSSALDWPRLAAWQQIKIKDLSRLRIRRPLSSSVRRLGSSCSGDPLQMLVRVRRCSEGWLVCEWGRKTYWIVLIWHWHNTIGYTCLGGKIVHSDIRSLFCEAKRRVS